MTAQKEETVWQKNNMAPLEFCSLERASRLLECEIDDLWHWQEIGAINFAVNITKPVNFICGIFHPDDIDCSSLTIDEQNRLKLHAVASLGYGRRGFIFSPAGEHVIGNQAINIKASCSGVFNFETKINRFDYAKKTKVSVVRIESNKYATVFIAGEVETSSIDLERLIIIRAEIDKIYQAISKGEFDNIDINELDKHYRVTVHQSNMILALLRMIGLSEIDIFQSSPASLNKKISQLAASKSVSAPQPDKETWVKWRSRFR